MINLAILENNIVKRIVVFDQKDEKLAQEIAQEKDFAWIEDSETVQIDYSYDKGKFIAPPIVIDEEAQKEVQRQMAEATARIEAKKSALAKLTALGLTEEEVAALL